MNIIFVQLILLCFSIFMVYRLFLHWKKGEINQTVFIVWILIWGTFIMITIFPRIFEMFLFKPFFVRVMDFGMICAFIVLTYLTFENNVKIKKHESEVEKLVRNFAIKNKVLKKKSIKNK